MEYHHNRFDDFSLMVYNNDKLVALLPANKEATIVYSHNGLSYGGLLLSKDCKFEIALEVFKAVLRFLKDSDVLELNLKTLPKIYHLLPSNEMDYLLFITKAVRYRSDVSMVIDNLNTHKTMSSNRKRNLKKAKSNAVLVKEVTTFEPFFNEVLIPNLQAKYQTLPVHTVNEITLLKSRFQDEIRQFNAYHNDQIISGVTIFETKNAAHAQYISTLSAKNNLGGLDAIFDHLINSVFKDKRYFSFGISNENHGQNINQGLLNWKESFGANATTHDFYSIKTENYKLLDDVMI